MTFPASILQKARSIKCVVFDVDGVLTDGRLYYQEDGREQKVFHVHDGLGIKLLAKVDIQTAIISSRTSSCVTRRTIELGMPYVYQNVKNKLAVFQGLLERLNLEATQVAYVGDDVIDIPVLKVCGLPISVANAQESVHNYTIWKTKASGGQGAAREVCELLLKAKNYQPEYT